MTRNINFFMVNYLSSLLFYGETIYGPAVRVKKKQFPLSTPTFFQSINFLFAMYHKTQVSQRNSTVRIVSTCGSHFLLYGETWHCWNISFIVVRRELEWQRSYKWDLLQWRKSQKELQFVMDFCNSTKDIRWRVNSCANCWF